MVVQHTKNQWIIHFKMVNFMLYEFYLNFNMQKEILENRDEMLTIGGKNRNLWVHIDINEWMLRRERKCSPYSMMPTSICERSTRIENYYFHSKDVLAKSQRILNLGDMFDEEQCICMIIVSPLLVAVWNRYLISLYSRETM